MSLSREGRDPEEIRKQLMSLLESSEVEMRSGDLRAKVKALVPVCNLLRDLGSSLVPTEDALSARDRILRYFLKYPRSVVSGDELMVVSGIQEWARRVRELRVQFGWSIISGSTAKEMYSEEEFPLETVDVSAMKPDDYILLHERQDRDAADRWRAANEVRRSGTGVRDKILEFLRRNVGKPMSGEELRYVAGNKTEWARRVRELRTEHGWPVVTNYTGRPDLPVGVYLLEADRQSPKPDRNIPDSLRREVLRRDQHLCTSCHWSHALWNKSDARHLELHHVTPHARGGATAASNLTTLCTVCHDKAHASE